MMKKTILASMFALSMFGAGVFAQGGTEDSNAQAAAATTTTTTVAEPKDAKTPEALGMDLSKHIAHVPQGGTPKSAQQAVGVVKN
jgi:hypothetical protein